MHAIMLFLAGDNSLDDCVVGDLLEMEEVGSSDDLIIFACVDRSTHYVESANTWTGCRVFRIQKSQNASSFTSPLLQDFGREVNCGDPAVLLRFVKLACSTVSAKTYSLVLWSHGSGWKDFEEYRGASPRFARSIYRHPQHAKNRGIALDSTSGDFLDIREQRDALAETARICSSAGGTLQWVGYDACLMGSLELIYETAAESGELVLCSQEAEPGSGWAYNDVLSSLAKATGGSLEPFVKTAVDSYIEHHRAEAVGKFIQLGAVSTCKVPGLAKAISDLGTALLAHLPACYPSLCSISQKVLRMFDDAYIDILSYTRMCCLSAGMPAEVKQQAAAVSDALSGALVYSRSSLDGDDAPGGLGLYFPTTPPHIDVWGLYLRLKMTTEQTGWRDFLQAFFEFEP